MVGIFGSVSKPRSRKPFAWGSSSSAPDSVSRTGFSRSTVDSAPGSRALSGSGSTPVSWGSVSSISGDRSPSPLDSTSSTKRCPSPEWIETRRSPVPASARAALSLSASRRFSSVEIRPARRSVTLPSPSSVAKLPRATTSPGPNSTPTPSASSAPRPMSFSGAVGS